MNEDLLFLNLSYTRNVVTYMSRVDSAEVFATEIKPMTLRKNAQLRGWPKPLKIEWSTIIFTSLVRHCILGQENSFSACIPLAYSTTAQLFVTSCAVLWLDSCLSWARSSFFQIWLLLLAKSIIVLFVPKIEWRSLQFSLVSFCHVEGKLAPPDLTRL